MRLLMIGAHQDGNGFRCGGLAYNRKSPATASGCSASATAEAATA